MKNQLAKMDVLILDELGYVPASKLGSDLLFDVISAAYEQTFRRSDKPTVRAMDRDFRKPATHCSVHGSIDPSLHILEATSDSFRLSDSSKTLK